MTEKIVDLSHPLYHEMPVWPDAPACGVITQSKYEESGWNETVAVMDLHTGTHMDAPWHCYDNGLTLDRLPLDALVGDAAVVHVLGKPPKGKIGIEDIKKAEKDIVETKRIILNTGWYQYFGKKGKPDFYREFPELTLEAAQWLADRDIVLYATDAPSPSLSENKEVHLVLFNKNIPVLENMTNLGQLTKPRVYLIALPLNFRGREGSPVRAVAIMR